MVGSRRRLLSEVRVVEAGALVVTGCLTACGGEAAEPVRRAEPDEDAKPTLVTPMPEGAVSAPSSAEAARAGDTPFVEPGCQEAPERVVQMECDPFSPDEGCGPGYGCKPFVLYPDAPCEPEIFGAWCEAVGSGVQGDPCNVALCAAGFLCVTTGQGTQCAELCAPSEPKSCPVGLICASIDIEGIGTCF